MGYLVYIMFSERLGRFYCGQTDNLEKRIATHNNGGKKYTSSWIPWTLIRTYGCNDRTEAIRLERKIKKGASKDTSMKIRIISGCSAAR